MAVLYIDESGEEGLSPSSSEWFVIGGALVPDYIADNLETHYKDFRESFHSQKGWSFHFQKASHDTRLGFISMLSRAEIRCHAVAFHKPSLIKRDVFSQKYKMYFYALRFMLERVTRHCGENDEVVKIHLSTRRGLSTESLSRYLHILHRNQFTRSDRMKWDYVDIQNIDLSPTARLSGLQAADCVASSLYKALETSKYGTVEPRYIADMYGCFHRDGMDYGKSIKTWPTIPREQWHERLFPAYKMGRKLGG